MTDTPLVSIEEFEEYLRVLGKKERTVKTYVEVLKSFEKFLKKRGKTFDDFTILDAQVFASNVSTAMANVFVPAIRTYTWLRVQKAKTIDKELKERELDRHLSLKMDLTYAEEIEVIKESALEADEVEELIKRSRNDELLQSAIVVHAYFGLRPVEGTGFIHKIRGNEIGIGLYYAQYNWDERYLRMFRAKIISERFLVWHPVVILFLKRWIKGLNDIMKLEYPYEWLTKKLKSEEYRINDRNITAMTFRKTFRTMMEEKRVEDRWIKYLMGHKIKIERKYQDMTKLLPILRDIMENPEVHYLIPILENLS